LREQRRLELVSTDIAETLINAMEAKNPYLRGHSQRVADLAASMAEALSTPADVVEQVRLAGRLHDVGKIGIREGVLDKPGRLEPHEYAHVQEHVRIGLRILAPLTHLGVVLDFIAQHHERLDGSGYPCGLSGDAISLGGRIIATADVFDALTSRRSYRDARTEQDTLTHMQGLVGTSLFPDALDALRRVVEERRSLVFLGDIRAPGEHVVESLEMPSLLPNGHGTVRPPSHGPSLTAARQRCEQEEVMAAAIRQLPRFERTVLALAYVEELTDADIARVFGLDAGAVCDHRRGALRQLSATMR
jgi:putative nucleotidyltransferase with HDIG domain